ncbi:PEP_CTERM-anchored TLD domain-containing protein [Massilia suwonensis]|uniref:PEP_CTERM-anchored TLD domain-containing protein n=1 Tax=Massilia suwonensis TaxID=648895 RepID=A0ABW0MHF2_9BURK
MFKIITASLVAALTFGAGSAHAGVINGGSALLNKANVEQLGGWLGQGVDLTKVYAKSAGSTSYDFHNAVDGKGPTFVVMQATNQHTGVTGLIGGYNPQSWDSYSGYKPSYDVASRPAFLFNLDSDTVFRQRTDSTTYSYYDWWSGTYYSYTQDNGLYQTYNYGGYGPTFGNGHDLYVDQNLSYGYSNLYAYASSTSTDLLGNNYGYTGMTISGFEVFTFAPERNDVPEPGSLALFAIALAGVAAASRKRAS